MIAPRHPAVTTLVLVVLGALGGCSKTHETTFSVTFPSVNVAALTETLETSVFAVSRDDACEDIFERRRTNQTLPAPMTTTGSQRVCDVHGGRAPALEVGFGTRAFLVVGKRAGDPFVMGCEVVYIDDRAPPPVVHLTLFDAMQTLPPTDCNSLDQRCADDCR